MTVGVPGPTLLADPHSETEEERFMPTLQDQDDLRGILDRLGRMTPAHHARWGTLDAHRMLCHLSDALAVALGEIPASRKDTLLTRTLAKWLVVNSPMKAPRGRVKTAPEMLTTPPSTWEQDLGRCRALARRVASGEARSPHPAFGPMRPQEWGRLAWKHFDHHLTQFGE
jgi:hypothetical protein